MATRFTERTATATVRGLNIILSSFALRGLTFSELGFCQKREYARTGGIRYKFRGSCFISKRLNAKDEKDVVLYMRKNYILLALIHQNIENEKLWKPVICGKTALFTGRQQNFVLIFWGRRRELFLCSLWMSADS